MVNFPLQNSNLMSSQKLVIEEEQQSGDSDLVEALPPNSKSNSQDTNEKEVIDLISDGREERLIDSFVWADLNLPYLA